jgi:hypothetical protein
MRIEVIQPTPEDDNELHLQVELLTQPDRGGTVTALFLNARKIEGDSRSPWEPLFLIYHDGEYEVNHQAIKELGLKPTQELIGTEDRQALLKLMDYVLSCYPSLRDEFRDYSSDYDVERLLKLQARFSAQTTSEKD